MIDIIRSALPFFFGFVAIIACVSLYRDIRKAIVTYRNLRR